MINAYTDFDSTCYYLLLPSEHLARGLEILAVLASGASFTAGDVKLEKDIIIEEIKQYENEPEIDFIEFIQANYFDRNPLKYPVLGTLASLKHATYPALRAFYDRYYVPGNAVLSICGDLQEAELEQLCATRFAGWKSAELQDSLILQEFLEPERTGFSTKSAPEPIPRHHRPALLTLRAPTTTAISC